MLRLRVIISVISLQISKTLGSGRKKRTKSATATTDLMLGMMDLKIGRNFQQSLLLSENAI